MQPLKNKTIIITRSETQFEKFIIKLEILGAKTIALPLIKTSAINQNELKTTFNSGNYNWLIFTSANAVQFFFKSVNYKSVNTNIAVVGNKTQKAIEKIGLEIDFIPTQFTAKDLAKNLPISENDSILIPRSDLAKNDIVEILRNRSCRVKTLSIYKNGSVNYSKTELNNIFNQHIDFITFTSGSTIESFTKLGININSEKVICIGPETAKIANNNNISVAAIANPHTIEGMIDEMIRLTKTS